MRSLRFVSTLLVFVFAAAPALLAQTPPPALTADDLFDPNVVHDLHLTVNTRDWRDLKEDFRENTYYLADLRWRDLVVRNVGIRSRGTGSRSPIKPGLRVDFDRYSSEQEFVGLKSIVLDNHTQDPSMLAERVSMKFFGEMGIPAPRVVHARLYVNNEYAGLYAIVESIDKRFLKRVFDENDGYLFEFKYADPYGFEYLGSTLEPYAEFFEPKTHERDSMFALFDPIRELVKTANESQDALFVPTTSRFLDLRQFVTYVAVENFLADNDGMVGDWGMNNFYLYRFEDQMLSRVLPWDKDSALRGWDFDVWSRLDENVLVRRALEQPELRQAYVDALKRCAEIASRPLEPSGSGGETGNRAEDAPAGPGWMEREIAFVVDQIREAARADELKPFDNDRFEDEISKKLQFARQRAVFVLRAIDADDR